MRFSSMVSDRDRRTMSRQLSRQRMSRFLISFVASTRVLLAGISRLKTRRLLLVESILCAREESGPRDLFIRTIVADHSL